MPIIVKADVHGSQGALVHAFKGLGNDEVRVHVIHSAVGAISETDINLARASRAVVVGFNVRADAAVKKSAESYQVTMGHYSVIYEAVDAIKNMLSGMLTPEEQECHWKAQVRQVFRPAWQSCQQLCHRRHHQTWRQSRLWRSEQITEGEVDSLPLRWEDVEARLTLNGAFLRGCKALLRATSLSLRGSGGALALAQ